MLFHAKSNRYLGYGKYAFAARNIPSTDFFGFTSASMDFFPAKSKDMKLFWDDFVASADDEEILGITMLEAYQNRQLFLKKCFSILYHSLSAKEKEVFECKCRGLSYNEIKFRSKLVFKQIDNTIQRIHKKAKLVIGGFNDG